MAFSDKNELFSPYCLFNCLSMAYIGADGITEEAMAKALFLNIKQEDLAVSLGEFAKKLSTSGSNNAFQFNVANSLWIDKDAILLPSYENTLENDFKAYKESISFSQPKESTNLINQWVKKQTQNTIPQLLGPKDVSKDTQLLLVSALYFKGSWAKPFSSQATAQKPFYLGSGVEKLTQTMHQTENFRYFENEEMQLVLLPFKGRSELGSELACFIVLPKIQSLDNIEAALPALYLQDWILKAKKTKVKLSLPKFTLQPKYDLIPTLTQLGMGNAFSPAANFYKMNGKFDLKINKVVHEAFFALDEKGVTASAATAIGVGFTCAYMPTENPVSFIANHPFLFGVVDLNSNVVLFLGKMVDP